MATLVDSNVILDVVPEDVDWMDWSAAMLARAAEPGRLVINPIVYAEVSVRFDTIEGLDAACRRTTTPVRRCLGKRHFSRRGRS